MNISFKGKRALVTGAGGSIGQAITELLVKCEATVVAVDVRDDSLHSLYDGCPQVVPVACDLANFEKTREMLTNQLPIDLLVNNAGIFIPKAFGEFDFDLVDKHYDVNVKTIINISQVIVNDWKARSVGGSIVNTASTAAVGGFYGASVYCSTKAAVVSLTQGMAVENGKHGIRVNCVRPGPVITPIFDNYAEFASCSESDFSEGTPTGRLAKPEDVAAAVCFLLSDWASNITGSSVTIDGGLSAKM